MIPGLTSVIIPCHNHGQWVGDAVRSALAQTAPVEVIVIDDGSTDTTPAVLAQLASDPRVHVERIDHSGPSTARNLGLDLARGEFVQFLDADDTLDPRKIALQLEAMDRSTGWVLCDIRIEDEARGRCWLASERYGYFRKRPTGWLAERLQVSNFIPIHSPLVRRSAIGDIRFGDERPEDWPFWRALAKNARARFVGEVLATYRKGRCGRSRQTSLLARYPEAGAPLRLNLGCGAFPLPGFVNLDARTGWRFETGLRDFPDHSVSGITISHALMYLPIAYWPAFFREAARVLDEGGVLRMTEDDALDRRSARYGGWRGSEPAVTLTNARLILDALERAGLAATEVDAATTAFADGSLCQARHGSPPDVCFVEGVRQRLVLFSPHNDDEALFAAFTILRYRPRVVICYPSGRDYGAADVRERESRAACDRLGAYSVEQWWGGHLVELMRAWDERLHPDRVWAPHPRASHPEHISVALAAQQVFGARLTSFHTYDAAGKVRAGRPVPCEPEWCAAKRRALSCYRTQLVHPRARAFFAWDATEYQEDEC